MIRNTGLEDPATATANYEELNSCGLVGYPCQGRWDADDVLCGSRTMIPTLPRRDHIVGICGTADPLPYSTANAQTDRHREMGEDGRGSPGHRDPHA